MEEMHKARYGEGTRSFCALSELATLSAPASAHQPGSSLHAILLGFYGGCREWLIKSFPLVLDSTFSLCFLPGGQGVGLKFPTF